MNENKEIYLGGLKGKEDKGDVMTADTKATVPNCYTCKFRRNIPGDAHSECANTSAHVSGKAHGIRNGWFCWPFNFDPVWLKSCDGYAEKGEL